MAQPYEKPPAYAPVAPVMSQPPMAPPPYSNAPDPKNQMYPPSLLPTAHIPPQGPPGYAQPYPVNAATPAYGATYVHQTVNPGNVILIGACPACRIGILEDDFTLCGVLCAIICFPIGILCCLAMRERRCSNCGSIYG